MPQAKKKVSKKKTAKKAVSKKTVSKKKVSTKKVTAKKAAPKKIAPKKVAPKKAAAKKTVAKKTAKATTKKAATSSSNHPTKKKIVPKKSEAKKTATKKATSKKSTPSKPAVRISTESMLIKDFVPYQSEKDEEYMNSVQIEHFRQLLGSWKKVLMEEVERTVNHMQDEAANFPDPNDRATQESEFSLELRNRDRERKLIKKINEAIANLSSGEYGYCEKCGIEIGIGRLEARPTATLCIDCKELDEIKERQYG
ncbi:RNA polymerase-binding transcription factor DksA [hydrothermal vent metagenome]|uniref:RNA polymerase-binding transcription factor DksA n=1 Tax=hydrothermal vent metagenome TaxID=652676 RepID=A0A3B0YS50_9ZZZZ